MANLDLSHVDLGIRRLFSGRLDHTRTMLLAAALASLMIVLVAAAMMVQI